MKCIQCESDARAVCQFCGRAVCSNHIGTRRFISGFTAKDETSWNIAESGVLVEDAVWCGLCHPEFKQTS